MDLFTKNLIVIAVRYLLRWLLSNERNHKKPISVNDIKSAKKLVNQAFDEMGFGRLDGKNHKESE